MVQGIYVKSENRVLLHHISMCIGLDTSQQNSTQHRYIARGSTHTTTCGKQAPRHEVILLGIQEALFPSLYPVTGYFSECDFLMDAKYCYYYCTTKGFVILPLKGEKTDLSPREI